MKMTEIGGLRVFSSKADPMIDQLVYEGGGKTEGKGIRRFLRWSSHIHDNIFCRETPSVVQESTR